MAAPFEIEENMEVLKQNDLLCCNNYSQSTINVEIVQNPQSSISPEQVRFLAENFLKTKEMPVYVDDQKFEDFEDAETKQHICCISLCDVVSRMQSGDGKFIYSPDKMKYIFHVYKLNEEGPGLEEMEDEELSAANHWILPSKEFHGLWDCLIYDTDVKSHLFNFVSTTILFSDRNVDSNIISCNRVVLLHGPPGTGKTSLCKALAQKLSIRLKHKYAYGQLIEINSHSLFSKWFSESGKLVMRLFQKIQEVIDDPRGLVFVLIDEVESLVHARKASGSEPSDAIRVVNALLTQIDQLRRFPNVVVLTTSNITEAIDLAFVDRADIKYYVGLPSVAAVYQIYRSCVEELQRTGIVAPKHPVLPLRQLNVISNVGEIPFYQCSCRLLAIAQRSLGLSGRTLRRLPFLAHALYVQVESGTMTQFLDALEKAVERQFRELEDLEKK